MIPIGPDPNPQHCPQSIPTVQVRSCFLILLQGVSLCKINIKLFFLLLLCCHAVPPLLFKQYLAFWNKSYIL
jgi:hypothetical protein